MNLTTANLALQAQELLSAGAINSGTWSSSGATITITSSTPVEGQGLVTVTEHGAPFVAAVELGRLWATQFHPEKSGDAGAGLLANWLDTL